MREYGTGSYGAVAWFFQRISGIVLLVMLLITLWGLGYSGEEGITLKVIADRIKHPWWRFFNLAFWFFALTHGINGLVILLQDYVRRDWARLTLYGFLMVLGSLGLVLGAITILPFK